jgi:mannose-6-phosphate isomerase-like protein (cupin superfamily)
MIIGNVGKQQKEMKGWLVGQFFPKDSDFNDSNVEVCLKTLPVGKDVDVLHLHPVGKDYLIVIEGRAKMRVGEEELEIKKGDYFTIPNNTPEQILEVFEEFTFIGIRCSSIPDNKVFL